MEARDFDRRYKITQDMEQEIWRLRFEEGCSQAQIACELGGTISQSGVSRCLQRIIKKNLTHKEG